jgi:hypothetical protein
MSAKPIAMINGQAISGSFWGRVLRWAGGDPMLAGRMFYRAQHAENVVKWMSAGHARGYLFTPCAGEDENPSAVTEWVEVHFGSTQQRQPKPTAIWHDKRGLGTVGDTIRDILPLLVQEH